MRRFSAEFTKTGSLIGIIWPETESRRIASNLPDGQVRDCKRTLNAECSGGHKSSEILLSESDEIALEEIVWRFYDLITTISYD